MLKKNVSIFNNNETKISSRLQPNYAKATINTVVKKITTEGCLLWSANLRIYLFPFNRKVVFLQKYDKVTLYS